jgi:hypothetical protein
MDVTAPSRRSDFGAGQLLLADSRLAFAVLNEVRCRVLMRAFGVSRQQANLLTAVLVLASGHGAVRTAGRVVKAPLRVNRTDLAIGGFVLREGAMSAAGPSASEVSPFATLLGVGIAGGIAIPALRRATHRLRAAERRVRTLREGKYSAARRARAAGGPKLA